METFAAQMGDGLHANNNGDEMEQDLFDINDDIKARLVDMNDEERLDTASCFAKALRSKVRAAKLPHEEWEEHETKERVLHETQEQNENIRAEMKAVMDNDASMNMNARNVDPSKMIQRMEQLINTMQALMHQKKSAGKNSKPRRPKSTSTQRGRSQKSKCQRQKKKSETITACQLARTQARQTNHIPRKI